MTIVMEMGLIHPPVGLNLFVIKNIAPDIPLFVTENCVGCMECVTQCPDTAILGKAVEPKVLEERLNAITDEKEREAMAAQ